MNKISCVFLSDDIFIIHIFDKYIMGDKLFDKKIVDTISLIIKFNRDSLYENNCLIPNNMPIKKYKGIAIYKNIEDFTCNYIIIDIFPKKKRKHTHSIIEEFNYINIKDCCIHPKISESIDTIENKFMSFLIEKMKDFVFDGNTKTLYYNVLHTCENKYIYDENHKSKLDFDILMHSFLEINTKDCIESIEFNLYS
jgi:hypothetical protein